MKHPNSEIFKEIQEKLKSGLKFKDFAEDLKRIGVSRFTFNKYYKDSSNIKLIEKLEGKQTLEAVVERKILKNKETFFKKDIFLNKLEKTFGNISQACKEAGVNRAQFYRWIARDEEFKEKVDDIEEASVDFAESMLKKEISEGNPTAIIFFLKTKGKRRGYSEREDPQTNVTVNTAPPTIIFEGVTEIEPSATED